MNTKRAGNCAQERLRFPLNSGENEKVPAAIHGRKMSMNLVGWAKGAQRRAHAPQPCETWWARCALPTLRNSSAPLRQRAALVERREAARRRRHQEAVALAEDALDIGGVDV